MESVDNAGTSSEEGYPWLSAGELLDKWSRSWVKGLRTGWGGLDAALGGHGLGLGEITELCGEAGSGKTQLCHQLCAAVQIPASQGGLGGKAVYIDTEGSFRPQRLVDMWDAMVGVMEEDEARDVAHIDPRENVVFLRCPYEGKLAAAVQELGHRCRPEEKFKLVVVDSPALLWRASSTNEGFEEKTLPRLKVMAHLLEMAMKSNLAVVVTNQMRARPDGALEPCLGRYFAHYPAVRVTLARQAAASPLRKGRLSKAPLTPPAFLPYVISQYGVRDPPPGLIHQFQNADT